MKSVKRKNGSPNDHPTLRVRVRSKPVAFALLATLVLLGPVILAAEPLQELAGFSSQAGDDPGHTGTPGVSEPDGGDAMDVDWGSLLSALPPHLSPETALGPHAHWVFDRDGDEVKLREQGETGGAIFDLLHQQTPWDRVSIPLAPAGPEPLLQALQEHADEFGAELPELDLLRAQILILRLVPEAEQALAQLVVAYSEALRLEAEATEGLTPMQNALLSRDPAADTAWLEEDPERTQADLDAHRKQLAKQVDMTKRLAAADLLVRTIDLVREPLALPPAPFSWEEDGVDLDVAPASGSTGSAGGLDGSPDPKATGSGQMDPSDAMDPVYRLIAHATGSEWDATTWTGTGASDWDKVYGLIGTSMSFNPEDIPPIPKEPLGQALEELAFTLGFPGETVPLPDELDLLPETLADAVAKIVTARRVGLESGDVAVHTFLLLEATRLAQPTLEAWAALMDLQQAKGAKAFELDADLEGLLGTALAGSPRPAQLVAHSKGLSVPDVAATPPSLAVLLEREGLSADEAQQVTESLPVPVALGTAFALDGIQRFEQSREDVLSVLDADERDAVEAQAATVAQLMARPEWTFEEARLVESWARGMAKLDGDRLQAIQQSRVDALVSVEAAVAVLAAYTTAVETGTSLLGHLERAEGLVAPDALDVLTSGAAGATDSSRAWYQKVMDSLPRLVTTASAQQVPPEQLPVSCPDTVFSRCRDDVWFFTSQGGGILVTGFASTTITSANFGNPRLIIDLGGDDTYRLPAGAADPDNPIRVAIDLGGDDTYETSAPLAHGAAQGLGTFGILWNEAGGDTYRMTCDEADCIGGQGFGSLGGMGLLVDREGTDLYEAPGAWAHGTGIGQSPVSDDSECVIDGQSIIFIFQEETRDEYLACLNRNVQAINPPGGSGYLLNLGDGDSDEFRAGRGQGHGQQTGGFGFLYTDQGKDTRYVTDLGNPSHQGGHRTGDMAYGFLIDLGGEGSVYSHPALPSTGVTYFPQDASEELRKDDSMWIHRSVPAGVGFGLDSSLEPRSCDPYPGVVELIAGTDPSDSEDCPNPEQLLETIVDLVENADPEDLDEFVDFLTSSLSQQIDVGFCVEKPMDMGDGFECETPMNLLHLGGSQDNEITEPALIMIELGGNNVYRTEVAGPAEFWMDDSFNLMDDAHMRISGFGSYALDLSGDDHYDTPHMEHTQASVRYLSCDVLAPWNQRAPVSLLFNFQGNNTYEALGNSQGYAREACGLDSVRYGAAWLVDFQGDDRYISGPKSQGFMEGTSAAGSASFSGLIDLEGDDHYRFDTQGHAEASSGVGLSLLFDGGGKDTFHRDSELGLDEDEYLVDEKSLEFNNPHSPSNDNAFRVQGLASANAVSFGLGAAATGMFISHGPERNTYLHRNVTGVAVDLSDLKNNVTRDNNDSGDDIYVMAVFSDNLAWFTDTANLGDHDGDGAPSLVEILLGTDPWDEDDHPGTAWRSPERLRVILEDGLPGFTSLEEWEQFAEDVVWAAGLDDSDPWIRIPAGTLARSDVHAFPGIVSPGIAIGGRGDKTYDEHYGFIVSLGGNNAYTGPGIGGASDGVALVLDVGGGDSTYAPDSSDCGPDLGAAVNGIGILADVGGTNLFYSGDGCEGPTQGAAAEAGVGVLFTWNATNFFEASSAALAQGAGEIGFGVLADFGGRPSSFIAPNGSAQGYGGGSGFGVLFKGHGDGDFESGTFSQGAGTGAGFGFLYSAGGNDVFRMDSVGIGVGQGAGEGGFGMLVNAAGDNQYLARHATLVQGAGAGGGSGLLLDLGGHDTYRASDQAQGYGSGAGSLGVLFDLHGRDAYLLTSEEGQGYSDDGGCGLFLDAEGDDRYVYDGEDESSERNGEIWGDGCGFGIDLDGLGVVFDVTRDAVIRQVDLVEPAIDADPVSESAVLRAVVEVDDGHDEDSISRVSFFVDDIALGQGKRVPTSDEGEGKYTYEILWDTQTGDFPDGEYRLRASAYAQLADDESSVFGFPDVPGIDSEEVVVGVDNPPLMDAEFGLNFPAALVEDNLVDIDRLDDYLDEEGLDGALSPPLDYSFNLTVTVGRDLVFPDDSDDELADDLCQTVTGRDDLEMLDLDIDPEDCDSDLLSPGGYLRVVAENGTTGIEYNAFDEYLPMGTFNLTIRPIDQGDDWEDGLYDLEVTLTDGAGQENQTVFSLIVDGTPPESNVKIDWNENPDGGFEGWANRNHGSGNQLNLPWNQSDDEGVGVRNVQLFHLDEQGEVSPIGGTGTWFAEPSVGVTPIMVHDHTKGYHFTTVAIDLLGNEESPCEENEDRIRNPAAIYGLCYQAKALDENDALEVPTLRLDFTNPEIRRVTISDNIIRPGADVDFMACVRDPTHLGGGFSGIGGVHIIFEGLEGFVAHMVSDDDSEVCQATHQLDDDFTLYRYGAWGEVNQNHPRAEDEASFTFEVTATDVAGNTARVVDRGTLDGRAPRVDPHQAMFGSEGATVGRPGASAELHVFVSDHDMSEGAVYANVTAIPGHEDEDPVDCDQHTFEPVRWTCRFTLAQEASDGDYDVTFFAEDSVGNANETVAENFVMIRGSPVKIHDARVVEVGHDWFRVAWNTSFDATSRVDYGRTASLGESVKPPGHRMEHSVDVTGLTPSTRYLLQLAPESVAGIVNMSALKEVRTLNAYRFEPLSPAQGDPVRGLAPLDFDLSFRAGESPVEVTVLVQDAAGAASPFEVKTFHQGEGEGQFMLDTTRFADGDYRVIYQLDRVGDRGEFSTPVFRIDNTPPVLIPMTPRPGTTLADVQPELEVVLIDPMGREPPIPQTLDVRDQDGEPLSFRVEKDQVKGDVERHLTFRLLENLPQGAQPLFVSVADEAGNVGTFEWDLRIDHLPPRVEGAVEATPLPGPEALKPGGRLQVAAVVQDDSSVAYVELDLSPLGGGTVPLFFVGSDRWEATLDVPAGAPHGTVSLNLSAEDSLGNKGIAGTVELNVDAHPPNLLDVAVSRVDYTSAVVQVTTDKPTRAWLGDDGPMTGNEAGETFAMHHVLEAQDLRPGRDYPMALHVVDTAGHRVNATVDVVTPVDEQPPGPVGNLTGESPEEGVVVLTWTAAVDNSGIDHYVVNRDDAQDVPGAQVLLDAEGFADSTDAGLIEHRDEDAPAGREATYRITAVDLAGNEGPEHEIAVDVLALPYLSDAAVSPREGSSDEPFLFQVTYQHAGGRPADEVTVRIGDDVHSLELVDPDASCREGCPYEARVQLKPTPYIHSLGEAVFQAALESWDAEPVTVKMPLVARGTGDGGVLLDDVESLPGPAFVPLLTILCLLAAATRGLRGRCQR